MIGERYTVEPNGARGWYVADNLERRMASGPYPGKAQAAYECDRLRQPLYPDGAARRVWEALCSVARLSWERDPTPRTYLSAPGSTVFIEGN